VQQDPIRPVIDSEPWPILPRPWAQALVTSELRSLAQDIVIEIRRKIPAYRRSADSPVTKQLRLAVEHGLQGFALLVCDKAGSRPHLDDGFRALGRFEAQAGRDLDGLQAAYRIGARLAWRRVMAVQERVPLPPDALGRLAGAVFRYMDDLAKLSAEGYQQEMLGRSQHVDRLRTRLLQRLLDQPATPPEAIVELAAQIGWTVPDQVVVIDISDGPLLARPAHELFGAEALVGLGSSPTVLVPAPLSAGDLLRVRSEIGGAQVSIGCAVPLAHARQSLQWAQSATHLRLTGTLPKTAITECESVLPTLLLAANPLAVEVLVRRQLGPLLALSPAKRWKYGRLLSTWLERGGSQTDIADLIGLHRQTVQYQFTRLQAMLGPALRHPDARVEMVLALRASLPDWEREAFSESD
jgi:hypothetical protein